MKLSIYVSTVEDGSMKETHSSDKPTVTAARKNFLESHGISPASTTRTLMNYDRPDFLRYSTFPDASKGDGIIREQAVVSDAGVVTHPDHALFLPLADCIGAVLYDPTRNILMVSHLGRHNLEQYGGIKSVEYLIQQYNIHPKNLTVWLSPAAGGGAYPLFAFNNRSLHDVAMQQIQKAGVLASHIEVSVIDVAEDDNYFSHSQFLKGNRLTDGRFAIVAHMTE